MAEVPNMFRYFDTNQADNRCLISPLETLMVTFMNEDSRLELLKEQLEDV